MTPPFDRTTGEPALSIRQPWAELILAGRKTLEIRRWATEYRGPLWIHTGQTPNPALEAACGLEGLFHGGFVGCVELASVVLLDRGRWERWRGKHLVGGPMPEPGFGWVVRAPRRLAEPIPYRGQRGLFPAPLELSGEAGRNRLLCPVTDP